MTNIIRPTRKPRKPLKGKRTVTIMNRDAWAVQFLETGGSLMIGPKTISGIAQTIQQKTGHFASAPEPGSSKERALLISMLHLNEEDTSRVDANAKALGISFAQALRAELLSY